jgi:hypothetical protein
MPGAAVVDRPSSRSAVLGCTIRACKGRCRAVADRRSPHWRTRSRTRRSPLCRLCDNRACWPVLAGTPAENERRRESVRRLRHARGLRCHARRGRPRRGRRNPPLRCSHRRSGHSSPRRRAGRPSDGIQPHRCTRRYTRPAHRRRRTDGRRARPAGGRGRPNGRCGPNRRCGRPASRRRGRATDRRRRPPLSPHNHRRRCPRRDRPVDRTRVGRKNPVAGHQ